MTRADFFKQLIRYTLLGLLAGLAVILGNRVVTGYNCSTCPGSGICKGESDCSKFLSDRNGGE
ncbi:MAG: hypothetical protein C0408_00465 [Odoribacter sp.]|nr:hypothetical protein [Odoribacter sp.]